MSRLPLLLVCALASLIPAATGFDLPAHLDFQLGFRINVVPGPKDTSRARGLVVEVDKILSDKTRQLAVTGTISNYSDIPCENVDMHFAVTSYVGTGQDLGKAVVQPSTIPPGGTASFSVHISLGAEKPKNAVYTINAASPLVYGFDPAVAGEPISSFTGGTQ